ncbi:hypothetical protein HK100_000977 [Physocladia obscura]|uniref:Uncharacterized protein n=1 Tax=Physocladia obscura TaxID=109957 RepID=A0AAD5XF73_9FUNG|nr:hypothetical protein HK100_000977 [Physocladia obscura]
MSSITGATTATTAALAITVTDSAASTITAAASTTILTTTKASLNASILIPPISTTIGAPCPSTYNLVYACGWDAKKSDEIVVQCLSGTVTYGYPCVANASLAFSGPECVYMYYGSNGYFADLYLPYCYNGTAHTSQPTDATVVVSGQYFTLPFPTAVTVSASSTTSLPTSSASASELSSLGFGFALIAVAKTFLLGW